MPLDRNYYRATLLLVGLFCFSPLFLMRSDSNMVMAQTPDARKAEADQLLKQGNEQLTANEPEAALLTLQAALKLYRDLKDRAAEGQTLKSIGNVYYTLKNYGKAIVYQQQTLAIAKETKNRDLESRALLNLGNSYGGLKDIKRRIDYYQQALKVAQQLKDFQLEWSALNNLKVTYVDLSAYDKAIVIDQKILLIVRNAHDRQKELHALGSLASNYIQLGDISKAVDYAEQSLKISQEIHTSPDGQALNTLAKAYLKLRDYPRAIDYEQQALTLAKESHKREGEAAMLGLLGQAYQAIGKKDQAIDYFQQSISIAQEIDNSQMEGDGFLSLANVYESLGNLLKAIDYYQQALDLARKDSNLDLEERSLGLLGYIHLSSLADFAKAADYFQQQLTVVHKLNNRQKKLGMLDNLGNAHFGLDEYKQSIDFYQEGLTTAQQLGDRWWQARFLNRLGSIYPQIQEYQKAIDVQQKGLKIAEEIHDLDLERDALDSLGSIYLFLQNPKAIGYMERSLALAKKTEFAPLEMEQSTLQHIGFAYIVFDDYKKAIENYQQSLKIVRKIKDRASEGDALSGLGQALLGENKLEEAENNLRDSIRILESLRQGLGNKDSYKVSIFEKQSTPYRTLQEVLIARHKPDEALEISERGRTRAFVELLARKISPTPESLQTINPPSLQQIKQLAKEKKMTLIEYSLVDNNKLYIYVLSSSGEVAFRKVDLNSLNIPLKDLITTSRDALGVRAFPQRATLIVKFEGSQKQATEYQKQRLQQLYQLLIDPIADLLPKDPNDRVIFIPQSSLFLVPFPALQDANGKYLIEKHTILTAPSIQVLDQTYQLQQQRQNNSAAETLVVGNPLMPIVTPYPGEPPQQLNALPGAEAEANAIAPLLKTQALTGTQGTKAAIKQKMSHARIIHLATHGLLDDLRGLGSAIALAPDHPGIPNDGLLTAEEILDLKLSADLVVLSACDTGRGRITGDGVIGLSRSFISAGVPSLIVSLWAIPDAPTAELMTEFYTNWQVKKLDKAQALRQAMLSTMKAHPNPRDWAAFTLIGEAE